MEVDEAQAGPELLDLETYIAGYTGHAKIDRLVFIATKSAGRPLELEALKLAADELKQTDNTALYRDVISRIAGRAGPEHDLDSDWVAATDHSFEARRAAVDKELSVARENLVKESTRQGHTALGDLLYGRGEVAEAQRQYMRTRDYCAAPAHVVGMCLSVVRCCLELRNFLNVSTYVQRAEATPGAAEDLVLVGKLQCALGLSHLAGGKFRLAARAFASVPPEMGDAFSEVLSPADVATYGALCALASFDRAELASRVAESAGFGEYVGVAPPEIRDALHHVSTARYGAALAALDRLRPSLTLDPQLAEQVGPLFQAARARALAQYAQPFSTLGLPAMAEAFGTDVGGLKAELAALISSGAIAARIDSHAGVLHAARPDARAATYGAVVAAGEAYLRGTRSLLLRASMVRHDLVQRPSPGDRPDRPDRGEGPPRPGRHRQREGRGGGGGGGGGGDGGGFRGAGEIASFMGLTRGFGGGGFGGGGFGGGGGDVSMAGA